MAEKATVSQSERSAAFTFKGFRVGTQLLLEAITEPDGIRYPEGVVYITTSDPHRVLVPIGDSALPDPGIHVFHWVVDGVRYDVRVNVVAP